MNLKNVIRVSVFHPPLNPMNLFNKHKILKKKHIYQFVNQIISNNLLTKTFYKQNFYLRTTIKILS